MREPTFWGSKTHPLALMLLPVSGLYRLLERAHRFFVKPQHPGKPVICIGNLTAGGAGKTPTVQYLATYFAAQNKQVAILSRGYGGSLSHKGGPATRVDPAIHTAADVGDEPLMLAAAFPVFIHPDRFASLRAASAQGADIAIKDDGFQNPAMANHVNLIVIDGAAGLGNGYLLPAGPLRQSVSVSLARTDSVLILGPATHASLPPLRAACAARDIPVFHGAVAAKAPAADAQPLLAYCGIAKPEKFFASLKSCDISVAAQQVFDDHHNFTEADASALLAEATRLQAGLITTRKDMARLQNAVAGSQCRALADASLVLDIELQIDAAPRLLALIEDLIETRQANQSYTSY